jgi:hypothetical protein
MMRPRQPGCASPAAAAVLLPGPCRRRWPPRPGCWRRRGPWCGTRRASRSSCTGPWQVCGAGQGRAGGRLCGRACPMCNSGGRAIRSSARQPELGCEVTAPGPRPVPGAGLNTAVASSGSALELQSHKLGQLGHRQGGLAAELAGLKELLLGPGPGHGPARGGAAHEGGGSVRRAGRLRCRTRRGAGATSAAGLEGTRLCDLAAPPRPAAAVAAGGAGAGRGRGGCAGGVQGGVLCWHGGR